MLEKQVRTVDPEFVAWAKPDRCPVITGCRGDLVFHHEKRRGAAGSDPLLGGSDHCGLWLCTTHHAMVHVDRHQVEHYLGVSLWEFLFRQFYRWQQYKASLDAPSEETADVRAAASEALALLRAGQEQEAQVRIMGTLRRWAWEA